ncbi:MAG TPA: BamA/TamA family outer membrane protein [Bacteroidota bacterium]|nr:BamA/TamA family outer membrane protein [Bacteroidota bacterium]
MSVTPRVLVLALLSTAAYGQSPPEDPAAPGAPGKGHVVVLPALGYMPETRFIGGVIGGYFWQSHDSLRKSSVTAQALYSQNEQLQTGATFEIFSDSARNRLTGELTYAYWPGKFYGIGNNTPPGAEEPFAEKYLSANFGLYFGLAPGLSAGPEYELRISSVVQTSIAGELATGRVAGVENYIASGAGIGLVLDTRDDNFIPARGRYVSLSGRWYSPALGGGYAFGKYTLDGREYLPLGSDHIVALQAYLSAVSGSSPFQMLSLLGGDVRGRGYYSGRYRDNLLVSAQAEYRSPLLFRLGLVLFGGITQVSGDFAGLALRGIHPFAGFGVRFRLLNDTRVNLRLDWGYGDTSSGSYVGVNEAY